MKIVELIAHTGRRVPDNVDMFLSDHRRLEIALPPDRAGANVEVAAEAW